MANQQKIKFSLTSDYNGKGFQQVLNDMEKTSKESAKAADGVTKLANAASTLPGPIGEAGAKLSGFSGALKNIWQSVANLPGPLKVFALAAASVGTGIKIGMDIAAKRAEEAKERIERASKALQAGIQSRLNWLRTKMDKDLASVRDSISSTITAFDKLIGRINKVNSAKAEVKVAESSNSQLSRQVARAAMLAPISDENERAMLEARLNEQEAEEERAEIIKRNTTNEKEADRNLKNAQDRRNMLEEQVAVAKKALADAEADAAQAEITGTKDMKVFNDNIAKARKQLADVEEQLKDQQVEVAVAEEKRKAVIISNENALLENETRIIELNAATERLKKAQEKAASEQEKNAQIQSLRGQQNDLQRNAQSQVDANNRKIQRARQNIADIEKAQDRTRRGMAKDQEVHQGIGGEGFNYETDANGNPADLAGWERAQRYAARADRDAERANRAAKANEKEYGKLRDKLENGEKLSDAEMKKYDKLDKWNKERKGKEKEEQNIMQSEEDNKKILEDTKTAVENIKTKIDELTTK